MIMTLKDACKLIYFSYSSVLSIIVITKYNINFTSNTKISTNKTEKIKNKQMSQIVRKKCLFFKREH